ncbi:MAG: aminotransferase class IV [Mariprofundaceae bacterium]
MSHIAYVNGEFLPLEKARVSIEDRGFQFADGVYEVVACYGGRFLALSAHLERLARSCAAIELAMPADMDALSSLVRQTYDNNRIDDAMLYMQVTRGVAPRMHVPAHEPSPTLVITVRALPEPGDEKLLYGATGITLHDIRWQRCDIKSIALLASVMGKQQAIRAGADEAFWLDDAGHVLEGSATNIMAVIDGVLTTHPSDHHILGGITRDIVLRLAAEHGIRVDERPWRLDEPGLTECIMTSTTNAALAVARMNGKAIGDGKPGPVAARLRNLFLDYVKHRENI